MFDVLPDPQDPVAMLLFGVGLVLYDRFVKRLRDRHRQTWEELGEPTLIAHNTVANVWAVMGFLFRRGYLGLDDSVLTGVGRALHVFLIFWLGLCVCWFGSFFWRHYLS